MSSRSDNISEMSGTPGWRPASKLALAIFSIVVALPISVELTLLSVAPEVHRRYLATEIGFVELSTVAMLLASVVALFMVAKRSDGKQRKLAIILAVGLIYWGGEEISWGQSLMKWDSPSMFKNLNYQRETNLHNIKYVSLTNQIPRLALNLLAVAVLLSFLPPVQKKLQKWKESSWTDWLKPLPWCVAPAIAVIAVSLLKEARPFGYRELGETEEQYMAILIVTYAVSLAIAKKRGQQALEQTP